MTAETTGQRALGPRSALGISTAEKYRDTGRKSVDVTDVKRGSHRIHRTLGTRLRITSPDPLTARRRRGPQLPVPSITLSSRHRHRLPPDRYVTGLAGRPSPPTRPSNARNDRHSQATALRPRTRRHRRQKGTTVAERRQGQAFTYRDGNRLGKSPGVDRRPGNPCVICAVRAGHARHRCWLGTCCRRACFS